MFIRDGIPFAEHLSYSEEYTFNNKEEVSLPPSHPGYSHIKKYWNIMCEKGLDEIQSHYTATFDFQKDATLFMTYVKYGRF